MRERIEQKRQEYIAEIERLRATILKLEGAVVACNQLLAEEAENERPSEIKEHGDLGGSPD